MLKNWKLPRETPWARVWVVDLLQRPGAKSRAERKRPHEDLGDLCRVVMCYTTERVLGANKMAQKFPVRDH